MKLAIMTKSTFFVEEDKILAALFDVGLDNLHLYKPETSPIYSERLLSLLPDKPTRRYSYTDITTSRMNIALQEYILIMLRSQCLKAIKVKSDAHVATSHSLKNSKNNQHTFFLVTFLIASQSH